MTVIDYSDVRKPRFEMFGLSRVIVFELTGERRYWALWMSRNKAVSLRDYLAHKSVNTIPP
jgi:hypothetical protein